MQNTRTRPVSHERQTLLTNFCKKTKSQEDSMERSEEYLVTQTVNRAKMLED